MLKRHPLFVSLFKVSSRQVAGLSVSNRGGAYVMSELVAFLKTIDRSDAILYAAAAVSIGLLAIALT